MIPAHRPQTTAPVFAVSTASSSPYRDRLHPWCIVSLLPKMQQVVVARFRRRNDAEAHLKLLRQMLPHLNCVIGFDAG